MSSTNRPDIGISIIPSRHETEFIIKVTILDFNQLIFVKYFTKNNSIIIPIIITFMLDIPDAMYKDGHTTSAKAGVLKIVNKRNKNNNFFNTIPNA